MPLWPQFCAGAYTMRSANIDTEACINLFPETVESKANAKKSVLYGTPGLTRLTTVTDTICRGMFSHDGRTFAVMGSSLYELTLSGSQSTLVAIATLRGSSGALGTDGLPCFFATNGKGGNQLAIVSAGKLYIFTLTTNTLSVAVTLPLTNAAGPVLFLNGYFLLIEVNSLKLWFSELEDGTKWDALDFAARSNTSDNVVGMVALHDQIKVFGSKTSEIFYNAGEADNPFLPYPGSIAMDGALAATGICVLGESMIWVAKNEWDVLRAMRAGTGEATVISTPAVEFAWASYGTVTDVEVLPYEQEGHPFVNFTFPTADVTWTYDLREAQWHQRDSRDAAGVFHRWRARGTCAPGNQTTLVGDYQTGDVYALSLDRFDENCTKIRRLRRAPYLGAENQWLFLDQVELGLQAGVGTTLTPAPNVNLRVSRDFGNTYNALVAAGMGASGQPLTRAIWRRLGRARADQLVLEVSQTDAVRAVWGPGLWLRITQGSEQL